MDYFALCDDLVLREIFDALGDDAAAIIARSMLRATCRRFAALLPTSIARYNYSWVLAQSMIVARKYAHGRADLVREILCAQPKRDDCSRDDVIKHWQHIQKCAMIGMSAENFALICAQYIDHSIDNIVRVLYSWTHSYSTYDTTLLWMTSNIYHTMSYWSSDSTITFLRKFLSEESLRFLDHLTVATDWCARDRDPLIAREGIRCTWISDKIARNIKVAQRARGRAMSNILIENAIIEIIARITIAREYGSHDPRIAHDRETIERIFVADATRELVIAHIEDRAHPDDLIPYDINWMPLYSPTTRAQCIRTHQTEWSLWCEMLFDTARATIPSDLLSHAHRAMIVDEIARNKRQVTTHRAMITYEYLAAAYGISFDHANVSGDGMHNEASCYFALITTVHQSPQTFARTMREYGLLVCLAECQIQQIITALINPGESPYIHGAYCATPRQNIEILRKYVHGYDT